MAPSITEEQNKVLHKIFYEEKQFYGRDKLYALIKERDLGISRRQLWDWLSKQEMNQLFRKTERVKDIQPTLLSKPKSQVGVDLMDMSNYERNEYKWLINAVDLFSKKLYSRPLKTKSDKETSQAFNSILREMENKPSLVRSDNGLEFKGLFSALLERRGIKQVFSQSYKPQSNGGVEKINHTMKQMIVKRLYDNDKYNWVEDLDNLVYSYNKSYHTVIKKTPEEAENDNFDETKQNIKKRMGNDKRENTAKFEKGDMVRIKEEGNRDGTKWSKEIFQVVRVIIPKTPNKLIHYKVVDKTGENLTNKYYNEDLQKINGVENEKQQPRVYNINRLIRPLVQNNQAYYEVKWKGYQETSNEPRNELLQDIPKIVRLYEKKNKVIWTKQRGKLSFSMDI